MEKKRKTKRKAQAVRWYQDKQNIALITGFISTGLTIANILVATILGEW